MSHTHPVDELADLREQMRHLRERAEILREQIIRAVPAEGGELWGSDHTAKVRIVHTLRLDTKSLKRDWGDQLAPWLVSKTTAYVDTF